MNSESLQAPSPTNTAPVAEVAPKLKLRTGSQMIAEGAVSAKCRFFAGYPITPASGIYRSMIEMLPSRGDVAISAPDEISALAYCIGASMRGYPAMTATSGPGWALMIESVQYAMMTEIPVVIALVQRLGPSTGGATQGAQGDVLLAEFCISGGYTIPVFCPSTPAECYKLAMLAIAWSERLRTPVVLLADKEVCMTSERVDYSLLEDIGPFDRPRPGNFSEKAGDTVKTYDFDRLDEVPPFVPVGDERKVTITGSAHNKSGELKKNDTETLRVLHHLQEKIIAHRESMSLAEFEMDPGAEVLIISFGITARAMRTAVLNCRAHGKKVSSLKLLTLFPIPERQLSDAAEGVKRVVVAEENLTGQYRSVISNLFKNKEVTGINKIGSMITPSEIERAIS